MNAAQKAEWEKGRITFPPLGPPLRGNWILFSRWTVQDNGRQIYAMPDDGSVVPVSLSGPGNTQDSFPSASPITKRIVFSRGPDYASSLYTMALDGSGPTQLTTPPPGQWDTQPSWSVNGKYIAFMRFYKIYIMNADGTGLRTLVDYTQSVNKYALDWRPTWSKDGTKIAFSRQQGGGAGIMTAPTQKNSATPQKWLTLPMYFDMWPSWSPDGSKVAFMRNDGAQMAIWMIDKDANFPPLQITEPDYKLGALDCFPCWNPTSTLIAFSRTPFLDYEIYTCKGDGTKPMPIDLSGNTPNLKPGHQDFSANWQFF